MLPITRYCPKSVGEGAVVVDVRGMIDGREVERNGFLVGIVRAKVFVSL